jgi:imidazolonepropionase-like amidohydrolase
VPRQQNLPYAALHDEVNTRQEANLVLLDANPLADISNTRQVSAVILNGRLIAGEDLQKMR